MTLQPKYRDRQRNPSRNRSHATLSVPWDTYDILDDIAMTNNLSLADALAGVLDEYQKRNKAGVKKS